MIIFQMDYSPTTKVIELLDTQVLIYFFYAIELYALLVQSSSTISKYLFGKYVRTEAIRECADFRTWSILLHCQFLYGKRLWCPNREQILRPKSTFTLRQRNVKIRARTSVLRSTGTDGLLCSPIPILYEILTSLSNATFEQYLKRIAIFRNIGIMT